MRKRPGVRQLVAISDEEVYKAYAVEHVDGVGAVQAFTGDETSVKLLARPGDTATFGTAMRNVGFDRLESIGILESRRTEEDKGLDFRWVSLHPTDAYMASFVANNPSFYSVERNVVPRPFSEVEPESRQRVEEDYVSRVKEYQPYWSDSEFRDARGIPDPKGMKPEANQAWADLATARNNYEDAIDLATDARDVQAAEVSYDTAVSTLWRP